MFNFLIYKLIMNKDELTELYLTLYYEIDLSDIDLKSLIDKNIVNTFGILEAYKIMYSVKKENIRIYKLKTYKRY